MSPADHVHCHFERYPFVISSEVEKSIYSTIDTNSPIDFLTPCIGEGWLSSVENPIESGPLFPHIADPR